MHERDTEHSKNVRNNLHPYRKSILLLFFFCLMLCLLFLAYFKNKASDQEDLEKYSKVEYTLEAGNYTVGVDIPSGRCSIEAILGLGSLTSTCSFGELNEKNFGVAGPWELSGDLVSNIDNVYATEDFVLHVGSGLTVRLVYTKISSSCQDRVEDGEVISMGSGTYKIGEDEILVPGVYNFVAISGQGKVESIEVPKSIHILLGVEGEPNTEGAYSLTYSNAVLKEGDSLEVERGLQCTLQKVVDSE